MAAIWYVDFNGEIEDDGYTQTPVPQAFAIEKVGAELFHDFISMHNDYCASEQAGTKSAVFDKVPILDEKPDSLLISEILACDDSSNNGDEWDDEGKDEFDDDEDEDNRGDPLDDGDDDDDDFDDLDDDDDFDE